MRPALPALVAAAILVALDASAADAVFTAVTPPSAAAGGTAEPAFRARRFRTWRFDAARFAEVAASFGVERPDEVAAPRGVLDLPDPEGRLVRFRVIESPIGDPDLMRRFPEIRTFRGVAAADPSTSVRFDVTPRGFSAQVLGPGGVWLVEPWGPRATDLVGSFRRRDAVAASRSERGSCAGPVKTERPHAPAPARAAVRAGARPRLSVGPTLKTYRLALATTGEYAAAVCAPSAAAVPCAMAAMATAVNRVTGIYENELAIRLVLVANDDLLVFTDPVTDPYTNDDGAVMLGENQATVDAVIANANYDVGHVFSTGGGGIAGLAVVCWTGNKAQGVTGLANPVGDAFYVDYVSHEIGHQFGADHSFNGMTDACATRNAATAYEPGSGSTIMAYAGLCDVEDLQPHSDPYFHATSFDEIVAYASNTDPDFGGFCPISTATGNVAPAPNAGSDFTIPSRTPFSLTGSATDGNGDPLTYCWEEMDLGDAAPPNDDLAAERPIFRSFNPVLSPTRVFPKLADVLSGIPTFGESLPTRSRTMSFRLTARDGRAGGGGVNFDTAVVTVVGAAGPFQVTAPSTAVTWPQGSAQNVTWDVAGTATSPINCANVAIELSTDGGATFPTMLLASTPNDGAQSVTVPNAPTTQARIRVSCPGNAFFNVSRPNFTIAGEAPTVSTIAPPSGTTAGGTAVSIGGSGFLSGATVSIGGVAATGVVFNSATSLSAVTGARAAGLVDVVVTNPGGGTGTLSNGYTYQAQSAATKLYPVTPCRIIDTRNPDGPLAGPILAASPAERTFTLAPGCGVPSDAKALSANVTVTQGTAAGSLRLYPSDTSLPVSTTISFKAGATRANNALLLLSAAGGAGRVTVRNDASSPVHLIVDVNGYFK